MRAIYTMLGGLSMLIAGCDSSPKLGEGANPNGLQESTVDQSTPKHRVVETRQQEKWLIVNAVIDEKATEDNLKSLARFLHKSRASSPRVGVYIYLTDDHYRAESQWVAMTKKTPEMAEPEINLNKHAIEAQVSPASGERFGLTQDQRRAIFTEIVRAEDRAERDAERQRPNGSSFQDVSARIKLSNRLAKVYLHELAKKHGLTSSQLDEIKVEALTNNWPLPPEQ